MMQPKGQGGCPTWPVCSECSSVDRVAILTWSRAFGERPTPAGGLGALSGASIVHTMLAEAAQGCVYAKQAGSPGGAVNPHGPHLHLSPVVGSPRDGSEVDSTEGPSTGRTGQARDRHHTMVTLSLWHAACLPIRT